MAGVEWDLFPCVKQRDLGAVMECGLKAGGIDGFNWAVMRDFPINSGARQNVLKYVSARSRLASHYVVRSQSG